MRRPARRRLLPLAPVLAATLASGCSSGARSPRATATFSTAQEPGVQLPDPAEAVSAVTNPITPTDPGTCSVTISGDVAASWTGLAEQSGATYGPWISPAQQQAAGASAVPVPATYFAASCAASAGRTVSFAANGSIPQRPAVYRFRRGTGKDSGSQSADDLLLLDVSPDGSTHWTVARDGKLTITAFDTHHVAGEFDIGIAPVGEQPAQSARLVGSFDFANTTA